MWKRIVLAVALGSVPPAIADVQYAEAEVVDVEPIVERIERVTPRQQCWFETRAQRVEHSPTKPLLGALIGGAIGNAVGHKKRNKQVGAVIGAVLGGAIASDMSLRAHAGPVHRVRQEVCEVVDKSTFREQVVGYWVTYRFGGETHRARMHRRPGETIRVRINVSPA